MSKTYTDYCRELEVMRKDLRAAIKTFNQTHGDVADDEAETDHCEIYLADGVSHEMYPIAVRKATKADKRSLPDVDIMVVFKDFCNGETTALDVDNLDLDALLSTLDFTEQVDLEED